MPLSDPPDSTRSPYQLAAGMNNVVAVALLVLGGIASVSIISTFEPGRDDPPGLGAMIGCGTGLVCLVPAAVFFVLGLGVRQGGRASIIASIVGASIVGALLLLISIRALRGQTVMVCFTLPAAFMCGVQVLLLARVLIVSSAPAWRGFEPVMPAPPPPAPPADGKPSA
jgi:hypothetical protein